MRYSGVSKLCSGGQSGADQGGLVAGETLRLKTGGWAPKGWKTENGPEKKLLQSFGLREHAISGYPPRTRANVRDSDGTVIIGNLGSRGSVLTARTAQKMGKPLYTISATTISRDLSRHIVLFREWLRDNNVRVLNVAGNRESVAPGIGQVTHDFLVRALERG